MADPIVEALDSEETPEERAEIDAALEASEEAGGSEEDVVEPGGKEPPEDVVEQEQEADPGEGDDEGAEEVQAEDDKESQEDVLARENRELKQLLRAQKKDLATMKAQLSRVEKGLEEYDDTGGEGKAKELSQVELLQRQIQEIGTSRGPIFETLVEAMELNPQYNDIRTVCSRENFDDIFEEVGKAVAEKEGIDPMEAQLALEAEVWNMPNPYKYMYGIIKKFHPRYAETTDKGEVPEGAKPKAAPQKEAPKAPASIATMGGGDQDSKSGWTARRIDNLPEDELGKVPQDIYEKYLRDELD